MSVKSKPGTACQAEASKISLTTTVTVGGRRRATRRGGRPRPTGEHDGVNPSTLLARLAVEALVPRRRRRTSSCAPGPAARRWRTSCSAGTATGCACTCATTSASRASPRSGRLRRGRRRDDVRHRGRQPPPGRARGAPRAAGRWSSSPPTGRPSCAAPGRTRPRELQADLFGDAVRARLDLPTPTRPRTAPPPPRALAATLAAARGPLPGPVHLDLGFTDPLVPDDEDGDAAGRRAPARAGPAAGAAGAPVAPRATARAPWSWPGDGAGAGRPRAGRRGRLAAARRADLRSAPAPGSVAAYRLLLELPELGGRVERVVAFGRPTLSRPVTRLLVPPRRRARAGRRRTRRWPEPGRARPQGRRRLDPAAHVARRRRAGPPLGAAVRGRGAGPWTPSSTRPPAHDRSGRPSPAPSPARRGPARRWSSRRATRSGTSTSSAPRSPGASGCSPTGGSPASTARCRRRPACARGRPVRVLVGDLAFLHDLNGAAGAARGAAGPHLQVVVLNDDGGGIFSLLEHGERAQRGPQRGGGVRADLRHAARCRPRRAVRRVRRAAPPGQIAQRSWTEALRRRPDGVERRRGRRCAGRSAGAARPDPRRRPRRRPRRPG